MSKYFLFLGPNFLTGMARVLDLAGTLNEYNCASIPDKADFYAIHSDWKVVGSEILKAMAIYEDQIIDHGED